MQLFAGEGNEEGWTNISSGPSPLAPPISQVAQDVFEENEDPLAPPTSVEPHPSLIEEFEVLSLTDLPSLKPEPDTDYTYQTPNKGSQTVRKVFVTGLV